MKFPFHFCFIFVSFSLSAQIPDLSLSYPISIFNSDTCCWRKLSANNYHEEAARLLISYYKKNKKLINKQPLYWHAGQCFAFEGQNEMAIQYMKKTYSPLFNRFGGKDGKTWYYYANGTVAFLERNQKKLSKMILQWEKLYPLDINYNALLLLQRNWTASYKDINRKVK